jgi:membrane-associated protein
MIESVMQMLLSNVALLEFLSPENILDWLGPWALIGVTFIIFAECGLLIGFFLPGDSLLFVTGLFVAQGFINEPIWLVATVLAVAAVAGNLVGYWIGKAIGPRLFDKPDSKIFKQEYVDKTHEFFEKYGARAIILARFVPIVRTFITATAGIAGMDFRKFATYSAVGGVIWGAGITLLGYFLGGFPIVKDNVEIVLLLVVFVSILPILFEYIRHRRQTPDGASEEIADEGF